ncbi:MAG: EAL domain-containing protein [Microthrixaceae bacterium]
MHRPRELERTKAEVDVPSAKTPGPLASTTALAAMIVALGLWLAASKIDNPTGHLGATNLLQLGAAWAAALAAGSRARLATGRTRQHLVLVALASASWGAAQAYWTFSEVVLKSSLPFPSLADVGFVPAYPLLAAAILRAPSSQSHTISRVRRILDGAVLAGAAMFLIWAAILNVVVGDTVGRGLAYALAIGYPAAGMLAVVVALLALISARRPWVAPIGLQVAGVSALALADGGFAYLLSAGRYETGSIVDVGWIVGWLGVGFAALAVPLREPQRGPDRVEPPGRALGTLPGIGMVAIAVITVVRQVVGHPITQDPVLFFVAVGVFCLNIARSGAARREGNALAHQLGHEAARSARVAEQHALAIDVSSMGIWTLDQSSGDVTLSPAMERMVGFEPGEFDGSIAHLVGTLHPDDEDRVIAAVTGAIERREEVQLEHRLIRRDGSAGWVHLRARPVWDSSGALSGMIGANLDVTEQHETAGLLRAGARRATALADLGRRALTPGSLLDVCNDAAATARAMLDADLSAVLRLEEDETLILTAGVGWSPGLVGRALVKVGESQSGYALGQVEPVVVADLLSETRFQPSPLLLHEQVRSGLSDVIFSHGAPWGVLGVHTRTVREFTPEDVSFVRAVANTVGAAVDRSAAEEELRYRSLHDDLTGLANRALLRDRLSMTLSRARAAGRCTAVVHIGVDRFGAVNQVFGQSAGDAVLVELSERLTGLGGPDDTVARLAADEFVIVATIDEGIHAVGYAERAVSLCRQPVFLEFPVEPVLLSASVGVAVANGEGDVESLMRGAAAAQARAAALGGGRYELFDQALWERSEARIRLDRELHHGVATGEIEAYYQPVVRISDGALVGVEALARWHHPTRGLLDAGEFMSVAESSDLVCELGEVVLTQAATQAARWSAGAATPFAVAVNVSPRQLVAPGFVDMVKRVLTDCEVPPGSLALEVVEGALMDDDGGSVRAVDELRRSCAMRIYMDDFGTGHSGLARLKGLPIDVLKIDRSFVTELADDSVDRVIAGTIVSLGHVLGMRVVAEGVETTAQLRVLAELDCDYAQGWLFDRALPAREIDALIVGRATAYDDVVAGGSTGTPWHHGAVDTPAIRVLVVDDHAVFGASLARALADERGIDVVGAVTTIPAALDALAGGADVVLSDFRLADGDGVALTRTILERWPEVRVVMLTAASDEAVLASALDAGCTGFVTKSDSLDTVLAAVRSAAAGEAVITPALLARLLPRLSPARRRGPNPELTPREHEVLALIAKGGTNQQIADELVLSRDTVRNHVSSVLSKLGAHSKLQAAAIAAQRGLVSPPS